MTSAPVPESSADLSRVLHALPPATRVLVTGGSGFIGTNLVEMLASRCAVVNADAAPPRDPGAQGLWTELDIRDAPRLQRCVRDFRPDLVLHAAARTDLRGQSLDDYTANTAGTEALLEALDRSGFRGTAIFFSSMLTNRPGRFSTALGEGDPDTHYGESKVLMEAAVRKARTAYRAVVVRPTSIWGPWFGEPYRPFFEMVIRNRFVLPAARLATKTFGYVTNTVYQVLCLATARNGPATAPIYLGDAPPVEIAEWAAEIARLAGAPAPRRVPAWAGRLAAQGGDLLDKVGIRFPLTGRRLRNLTLDNIVDLTPIGTIAPFPPFSRLEGCQATLAWLRRQAC